MKKIVLVTLVMLVGMTGISQNKNAKAIVEVDGVCGMCKQRIEKASLRTIGVKSAVWNMDTHELSLIYDERKTDLTKIQQNIADVGHDTFDITATEEAYNSVHQCCRYRDEKVVGDHDDDGGK